MALDGVSAKDDPARLPEEAARAKGVPGGVDDRQPHVLPEVDHVAILEHAVDAEALADHLAQRYFVLGQQVFAAHLPQH